jgi:orotidine-5'-phosphate decarboxylase
MGEATAPRSFSERLDAAVERADSLVCIGLDPDLGRLPAHLQALPTQEAILQFNREIVEATSDLVCAYKPNLAFYVSHGLEGVTALVETRRLIPQDIPVILDAKVGDIGSTSAAYARGYFERWQFDAVTANPFLGEDGLAPFFAHPTKGVIVLCKTSNPGSEEWQDVTVGGQDDRPLFLALAERANRWARDYPATIGVVVGATFPEQLARVRRVSPELPILLPGIGAQAGDTSAAVRAGLDARGRGLIVSSSRAVIYAGSGVDFAARARDVAARLRDEVNAVRSAI